MRRALEFLFGGAGGAALDRIRVRHGALSYPESDGQPWWVAPQFGAPRHASLVAATGGG